MSVFEKIAFLESFFELFELKKKIQLNSENEIDELLSKVSCQLIYMEAIDAKMQINNMPVFYN